MEHGVYFDHAATTALRPEVLTAMLPYFSDDYANPSSLYLAGRKARRALDRARKQLATAIGAASREIYFTSGGTEANNWAIKQYALQNKARGRHLITSAAEHHAVLESFRYLEEEGFSVTVLPVDADGLVDPQDLLRSLREDSLLLSIMLANNEIGSIQEIRILADIAHQHAIFFHTDAVQALGHIPVDVNELAVDALSLSAHKFGGPKGVGALYLRKGSELGSFMNGGAQEKGFRAGTENVPSIVGMGLAIELAVQQLSDYQCKTELLRQTLENEMTKRLPGCRILSHAAERLPGIVSVLFPGHDGETLLLQLDRLGFSVSTGSACAQGAAEASHVLKAIGLSHSEAQCALRFSLAPSNSLEDIQNLLEALEKLY